MGKLDIEANLGVIYMIKSQWWKIETHSLWVDMGIEVVKFSKHFIERSNVCRFVRNVVFYIYFWREVVYVKEQRRHVMESQVLSYS